MSVIDRGNFLRLAGSVGAGLCVAAVLPFGTKASDFIAQAAEEHGADVLAPNAWVRVAPDETVTVMVSKSEMGQGITTGFCTLVADELDVPMANMRYEYAPVSPVYNDPIFASQTTGGSVSTPNAWLPLRQAAASARSMLVTAAALKWGVSSASCVAEKGMVLHPASGRSASYGSLTVAAMAVPVPKEVSLKTPDQFNLIGKHVPRVDTPLKVNGKAKYGIDTILPGMVYATIVRSPVFGGTVASFDATQAKKVPGVTDVFQTASGVAIVGTNTWATRQGRKALHVVWNEGSKAHLDSETLFAKGRRLVESANVAKKVGDAAGAQGKTLVSNFEFPFLSHAPMEPMNATADVRPDGVDVYAPTQVQTRAFQTAMKITGLPADQVKIHTTFLGGGFGGRLDDEYVADAVEVSKKVGKPVKVTWPREEDMQQDHYRPMSVNALRGTLDSSGNLIAFSHTVVCDSIFKRWAPPLFANGIDVFALEGCWNTPYDVANMDYRYIDLDSGIPVGFMRAPGANANTFATEVFMDELAHAAGKDPYAFRMALLSKSPRAAGVLKAAAHAAGWGKPMPAGRAQGIALNEWGGSYGAIVAEVSLDGKKPVVHKTTMAVDVGTVVNPDVVKMQVQGAVNYGIAMAQAAKITIAKGRVQQQDFYSYQVLRNQGAPGTHVVIVPSTEKPTGIGELGTPPIAPAIANAIFKLNGKRLYALPFSDSLA